MPERDLARLELARQCWYLTGPTASGKTEIGLELARLLDAEIISLDSMAIYCDMDIGTAKPTAAQRSLVPHHLIDILSPLEEFSVSDYVEASLQAAQQIRQRGKQALFVGGTPLYLKSLLRGLFQGPPADWQFRRQIEEELQELGNDVLHQRLELVDPLSAAKLHPNDKRRIIRALEVYRSTGRPISHLQLQFEEGLSAEDCKVFVLGWPRERLHQRIDQRVDWMFENGLVEEVQGLLQCFQQLGRTASQAVGYREAIQFLRNEQTLEQAMEAVKARTHQFARRQETWFRSLSECRWIPQSLELPPAHIAQQIAQGG